MFEHARHFPRRGWDARDRHDRMSIYLQDFIRAIIHHDIAGSCTSVPGDQHATRKLERQDGGRFGLRPALVTRLRRSERWIDDARRTEQAFAPQQRRKILTRTRKILAKRRCNLSITRPCAGGSAWIDWGRPCAFF